MVNLCRIGAAGYQMFSYRKYHPKCLIYEIGSNQTATVRHPEFFNFNCWRAVDYPLVFGNLIGLFLHLLLVCSIFIAYIFKTDLHTVLVDPQNNDDTSSSDSDSSHADSSLSQKTSTSMSHYRERNTERSIKTCTLKDIPALETDAIPDDHNYTTGSIDLEVIKSSNLNSPGISSCASDQPLILDVVATNSQPIDASANS